MQHFDIFILRSALQVSAGAGEGSDSSYLSWVFCPSERGALLSSAGPTAVTCWSQTVKPAYISGGSVMTLYPGTPTGVPRCEGTNAHNPSHFKRLADTWFRSQNSQRLFADRGLCGRPKLFIDTHTHKL